jgi:hypothetical protein
MFQVAAEKDGKVYIRTVYAVRINPLNEQTEFLMWWMANWTWVPANMYRPATAIDFFTKDEGEKEHFAGEKGG